LVLSAVGAESVRAQADLRILSPAARFRRAAGIMLLALVLAAAIIPVPIVHLVGIPLILCVGLLFAVRQLRSVASLSPVRVACPRCGLDNSLGGGLGLRTTTGPVALTCESCRRVLEFTFHPLRDATETATDAVA
jgi:hypothetical protein